MIYNYHHTRFGQGIATCAGKRPGEAVREYDVSPSHAFACPYNALLLRLKRLPGGQTPDYPLPAGRFPLIKFAPEVQ